MTESISLRYKEGSSDKAYNIRLEQKGDGWVVNFEYGRYGTTLKAGSKTPQPLSREQAQKVYDRLVAEKKGDGYTDAEGGQAYVGTDVAGRDTGIRVQLLNVIESEAELETFILDDAWGMQEKWNGERRPLLIDGKDISGANRKGLSVAIAGEIADVARTRIEVSGRTVLDGEDFGTTFAPFDLLFLDGIDLRAQPYEHRLALLLKLIERAPEMPRPVTYRTASEKRAAIARLRDGGFEGVVFVRMDAPYTEGKPNSGGSRRKYPFRKSATCRVTSPNVGKRSVGLELLDGRTANWVFVGNVTIPPNFPVPADRAIVEINYAWANVGGAMQQPVFCGIRKDQDASDCVLSQLQYKAEEQHSQAA